MAIALAVVVLAGAGMRLLWKAIGSSQRTRATVEDLLGDPEALVALAEREAPSEFERQLRGRIEEQLRGAGSAQEAFRGVVAVVAERLSRRCLEAWLGFAGTERAEHAFAVHEYMRDYDVAEVVTGSGAYDSLTAAQKRGLEIMPERDSLGGDMRQQVRAWMEHGEGARVRWVASVEEPVAADVYGLVRTTGSTDSAPAIEAVTELWARYEAWLAANAPIAHEALRPPADPADLQRLEEVLGFSLPEGLRELYRVHDGQELGSPGVFPDGQWLPVAEALRNVAPMRSDPRWERVWCPFVDFGGSGLAAVRCASDRELVYDFWFEQGGALSADSVAAWLAERLRRVERSEARFDAEMGFVSTE